MRDLYWAKRAYRKIDPKIYDRERFILPADRFLSEAENQAVKELITLHEDSKVGKIIQLLDIACGTGRLAFYLEDQFKNAVITGVDINENMLEEARRKSRAKKSTVRFIKGDIYKLPFAHSKFDVITGLRFSMHLPHFDKALKELSRVLNKNGLLIFDILSPISILMLKILKNNINIENSGFYTMRQIANLADDNKLTLSDYKGIWFLGQTLIKLIPPVILPLISPLITPPKPIQKFSTKIVLCFQKIDN